MEKMHPSFGKATKGKAGSRTVDHPSMGKVPSGGNKNSLPTTSHAGGKPHNSMGGGEKQKYADPGVKTYAQGPQGAQGGGFGGGKEDMGMGGMMGKMAGMMSEMSGMMTKMAGEKMPSGKMKKMGKM